MLVILFVVPAWIIGEDAAEIIHFGNRGAVGMGCIRSTGIQDKKLASILAGCGSTKVVLSTGNIRPAKLPGADSFVVPVSAMAASGGVNRIELSPGRRISAARAGERVTVWEGESSTWIGLD